MKRFVSKSLMFIRKVKTLFLIFGLACLIFVGVATYVSAQPKDSARISVLIATGMPGGTYYQVGLGMASLWTTKLRDIGIRVSAAISEGSLENVEAIRIADADMILVEDLVSSMAFRGAGMYRGRPVSELRGITTLWPDILHMVVQVDRIKTGTLQDLEGLTIAGELPDSGNKFLTEMLLKTLKPNRRNVRLRSMSNMAAAEALRKGVVQGMNLMGGIPIPLVTTLFAEGNPPFGLLEITDAQMEAAQHDFGKHVFRSVIPAGTYAGQGKAARTLGQLNILAVTASLDAEVVYVLTKTLYENLDYLAKVHPACRNLNLDRALDGLNIPLHRGAARYYREKKLNIPEQLVQ